MNRNIRMQIEGSLTERLLNRALHAGAVLTRVRRSSKRSLIIQTDEHSATILSALCERYFLDCRILRRRGMPALMEFLQKRWSLLPALLLCCTICILALNRIWLIDVRFSGPRPELGNRASILSILDEIGIKRGMPAGCIDSSLLQKQLLSESGDASFVGVRRQGIRLLVEVSPEVPSPETYQIAYARDLVAARDGVVESISVMAGSACVRPGDTVRAGQTLIRGEETVSVDPETREEITAPVSALGEVIARCWYEGSAQGYIETEASVRTGRESACVRLKLMDLSLPLVEGEGFSRQETDTHILPVVGMFLPLELIKTSCYELRTVERRIDPGLLQKQLEPIARADALGKLSKHGIPCRIASHWTDAQQNDDILRLRAVYEIYTDIAATRDAFIEEVY